MNGRPNARYRPQIALATTIASAILAGCGAVATSAAADEAAWLFDPNSVVEINLGGLSQEEIDALEAEPDEYQPGTFELKVGGVTQGPPLGEVGIRLKGGHGSFRPLSEKAAFKIKFNEYVKQKFFGLKKLTLNNMVQDPSMLHETLAYELFRLLGVAAPRTGYADVRVNGVNYGIHLNVETYDDVSLPRWFASTGHLYEADEPGLDVVPGSEGKFEIDEGDEEDLGDLKALILAADDDEGDWSDGMAGVADLTQMARMWAVERYIGHWDGYAGVAAAFRPNNYYLHSEESGQFSMLPWGTDQTWVLDVEFDEPAGGVLFNRCLADASCEALYVEALRELEEIVGGLDLDGEAVSLAGLLAPWQGLEVDPQREFSTEEIEDGVESAREFIADRPAELTAWLPSLSDPPLPPTPEPEAGPSDPGSVAQPTAQAGTHSTPPAETPPERARVAASRLVGTSIVTRVDLPGAGRVEQRGFAKLGKRQLTVCTARASRREAGEVKLRCRLSKAARRHLRTHRLKLRLVVRVTPSAGSPETIRRMVVVPRLRRR